MKRDAGGFKDYVAPEISTSRKERTWEGGWGPPAKGEGFSSGAGCLSFFVNKGKELEEGRSSRDLWNWNQKRWFSKVRRGWCLYRFTYR